MSRRQKTFWIVICIAIILTWIFMYPFCMVQGISYAAEKTYSDVLEDLQRDTSFDMSFYPDDEKDNSLQVITIAESAYDELFVYVYQPSAKTRLLTATYINIADESERVMSFEYDQYPLKLLNRNGVFAKYLVSGLDVKQDSIRYYYISNILRPWIEGLDDPAPGDNKISQVPSNVSKVWEFGELNGKSYMDVRDIDTIVVTSKYCGFVRYPDGFNLYVGACDSHFVAFDTDKPIDKLLRAKLTFYKQEYSASWVQFSGERETFGDVEYVQGLWVESQECSYGGRGLFAGTYTWNRIQTIDEFVNSVDFKQNVYGGALINVSVASTLSEEAEQNIRNQKWVLRFLETSYEFNTGMGSWTTFSTVVGDVEILQLEFLYEGKTWNLGVVDNKQSGDPHDPVNDTQYNIEASDWLKKLGEFFKKILEFLKNLFKDPRKFIIAILVIIGIVFVIGLICDLIGEIRKARPVVVKSDDHSKNKPSKKLRKKKSKKKKSRKKFVKSKQSGKKKR